MMQSADFQKISLLGIKPATLRISLLRELREIPRSVEIYCPLKRKKEPIMVFAYSIVWVIAVYAGIGLAFALFFVTFRVSSIDQSAAGVGVGFRLIILPGVAVLWPLLVRRSIQGVKGPPTEINSHRGAAAARMKGR